MSTFEGTVENSPLAMATTEGPLHELLFVNPAFCVLQGKRAPEMLGRPVADSISGADVDDVLGLLDAVYKGEKSGSVNHLHYSGPDGVLNYKSYVAWGRSTVGDHMDGLVILVSDAAKPLRLNGLEPAPGDKDEVNREILEINERLVISAVHQQTLAEMASDTELRLRSLIQGLNAIVCEVDALTGTFLFVSERAESFLGYPIARWNDESFWRQIVHEDDYEKTLAAFRRAGVENEGLHYTFRVTAADGSEIWLRNIMTVVRNADGNIAKLRCVIVDATEQQSAHEALAVELERNRAIAEALQYSMLWQQPEKVFPGLTVAAFYEPAAGDARVGGDFIDAFKLPDKSIMFVVGDVTGKGLQAAARTVEVRFALRTLTQDYIDPAQILGRLNEFICDFHPGDDAADGNALVVLSLVVVDSTTGATQAASAGAEPPLILRVNGKAETIDARGLMLGIDRRVVYNTLDSSLNAGDVLLMTTDGLTEARHGNDFFGHDRLGETGRQAAESGTPYDIGKAIMDAARAHANGRFRDDTCLLVARRHSI